MKKYMGSDMHIVKMLFGVFSLEIPTFAVP